VAAPPDAVVFQGPALPVVGHAATRACRPPCLRSLSANGVLLSSSNLLLPC
jgi:hypothetical protein